MLAEFKWRNAEDDCDRKLLSDVQEFGWHVVAIQEDNTGPTYSFFVGLYLTLEHPEVFVMGLPHSVALQTINQIGLIIQSGNRFSPDQRYDNVLEGYDVIFRTVSVERYQKYLGYGIWFYRSLPKPFPTLQMVWPDKAGVFPWEPNYDNRFFALQNELWKDA